MDGWVIVRNWDRFQQYTDRRPLWIKLYTDINSNDEWLELGAAARGMLTTIWVEYARSGGHLRVETCMQLCGKSARSSHVEALIHAGFITVSVNKPPTLSRARARTRSKEEVEEELKPPRAKRPKPKPETPEPTRSNVIPADPVKAIEAMIRNGVIHDEIDLQAEIAGAHLNGDLAARLMQMLGAMP